MKSLVIFTHGYPCNVRPVWLAFVREIAHSIARQGVQVTVISPIALHRALIGGERFRTIEKAEQGVSIEVLRPRFLSFSSFRIGALNTVNLTLDAYYRAMKKALDYHLRHNKPDALYGHFLYFGGAVAVRLGKEYGIPSFSAVGEGRLCSVDAFGEEHARRVFADATGFLANSSELGHLLKTKLYISPAKVAVFPNGINRSLFYPRDRATMRLKYKLPQDRFLVCCVGYFTENKGPVRVGEAIRGLSDVCGVFVGTGPIPPESDNIVFKRELSHDLIPEIMSACDVFVLPTKYEGCCSAILEAMACGLPIISSQGAFNDDILNDEVSIRVDPLDVGAIRNAIIELKNNSELLSRMTSAALQWSENFDINERARRILSCMESKICSRQVSSDRDIKGV